MKWATFSERDADGDIVRGHIFPVNDDATNINGKEHTTEGCWCNPTVDEVNASFVPVMVHRAPQ